MNLLPPNQLAELDAHLRDRLSRLLQAESLGAMNRVLIEYVMAGGKRLRPQLCLWTYEQLTDSGATAAAFDVACGWEIFHAFLLAHDDIIDDAETRRGKPCLHQSLAALDSNSAVFGRNLAIVAGDLLFGAAMRLWHELEVPADAYRRLLRVFSRTACVTGFGQAIDILQSHTPLDAVREEELLREYDWKTAAYTFEGPMLSAAILAGVDDAGLKPISDFAMALGQAYQLQNDLIDLATPARAGCDLLQGKRTPTLVRARAGMGAQRRSKLDDDFQRLRESGSVAAAEALRGELREAACETSADITRLMSEASEAARRTTIDKPLSRLLKSLERTYFAAAPS